MGLYCGAYQGDVRLSICTVVRMREMSGYGFALWFVSGRCQVMGLHCGSYQGDVRFVLLDTGTDECS